MNETAFTRSRRASMYGLLLHAMAVIVVFIMAYALPTEPAQVQDTAEEVKLVTSQALQQLAWYLLAGIPLWFIVLLTFRQRELAELERLDFEQLKREKAATGGGEALFDEGGGGALDFQIAEKRLQWMMRWMLPAATLVTAAYLAVMGLYGFFTVDLTPRSIPIENWVIFFVLTGVMLGLFLYSRYASGMGRVAEWQLLRSCGSFTLGNAIAALAVLIGFGVFYYTKDVWLDAYVAKAIPILMLVLAAEFTLNFVLDVYRPRHPGAEPRAAFDSRLLALISEPGGIASSIAEAINYQFGFQVSQTWFYQLLQRTLVWLVMFGALVLWLMTAIVVVEPYERVIVERFGRQMNAEQPLEPGLHVKLPWPIEKAYKYNTGQIHEMHVGFLDWDATPRRGADAGAQVVQWTDRMHDGEQHFNFLIPPPPDVEQRSDQEAAPEERAPAVADVPSVAEELLGTTESQQALPVNLVRLRVAVQYRIDSDTLAHYTSTAAEEAPELLRNIAWEETVRFAAHTDLESLLANSRYAMGRELARRISERVAEHELGLEIVYVGVENIHPEASVSKSYREVIQAALRRNTEIRRAMIEEAEILAKIAGGRDFAREYLGAIERFTRYDDALSRRATVGATDEQYSAALARMEPLAPLLRRQMQRSYAYDRAMAALEEIRASFERGLGGSRLDLQSAQERVIAAEAALREAEAVLAEAKADVREAVDLSGAEFDDAYELFVARAGTAYWTRRLAEMRDQLQGDAAKLLAQAEAKRWRHHNQTASNVAALENEIEAYRAAPDLYRERRYLEILQEELPRIRKFFLAFDTTKVPTRAVFETREEATSLADLQTQLEATE